MVDLRYTPVVVPPGCTGVEEQVVRDAGWELHLGDVEWDSWQGQVVRAWFGGRRPMGFELRWWLVDGVESADAVRAGEARLLSQRPPVVFRR